MNFRNCEINTNLDYININVVEKTLVNNSSIINYAYIIHDKDLKEDGSLVAPHIHLMLRLDNSYKDSTISNWFGIKPQYVGKIKGRFRDALEYLTHSNCDGKYQYSTDDVISNFDFVKYIADEKKKQEYKINKRKRDEEISDIIHLIENGTIREFNQFDMIDIETWARNKTVIKNSLEYYREAKFMDKNRKITVIFCTGSTGTGKTTFAKEYAKMTNRSICISSCSNDVMQDYKGEDILVLDDLRDENFKFTDVLKMLDNHTKSTMFSRYFNKGFLGDTIIITSYKDVVNWYKDIPEESRIQLFRRVGIRYVFTQDYITSYHWDTYSNNYVCDGRMKNIYKIKAKEKILTGLDILKSMGYEKEGIKLEEIKEKVNNMSNEQVEKILVDDDLEEINEEENQEIQGIFKN